MSNRYTFHYLLLQYEIIGVKNKIDVVMYLIYYTYPLQYDSHIIYPILLMSFNCLFDGEKKQYCLECPFL